MKENSEDRKGEREREVEKNVWKIPRADKKKVLYVSREIYAFFPP